MSPPDAKVMGTYHRIEILEGNHLGPQMIQTLEDRRYERREMDLSPKISVLMVVWESVKKDVSPTVLLMDIEGAEWEFFRHADLSGIRLIVVELHHHIYHRPGMRAIREEYLVDQGFAEDREASGGGVFVFRRTEDA
ncbi:MAG: hypothetical protein ABJ364_14805 [Lentilitoribacter sp.]